MTTEVLAIAPAVMVDVLTLAGRGLAERTERYALAAAKALPDATQVADRWHLMENASRAFLDAVRKSMRQIRSVLGAATINPAYSPLPNAFNTKVISIERKTTPPFLAWQRPG